MANVSIITKMLETIAYCGTLSEYFTRLNGVTSKAFTGIGQGCTDRVPVLLKLAMFNPLLANVENMASSE